MSTLSKFGRINFEDWGGTASVEGGTPVMELDYNDNNNFAIYTSGLTAQPTFRITNFPRFFGFNNKVFTYTLAIRQNSTPQVPGNFLIIQPGGGISKSFTVGNGDLLWQGGIIPTGNANKWDFFNFILINTGVPAPGTVNGSSFDGYECFANLNGNYPLTT
jgi:hypothetical protein